MRITQAHIGIQFFKDAFLKKFNLVEYHNPNKPAIFFGLYPKQRQKIFNHKSLAVIVWGGSDALYLLNGYQFLAEYVKNRPNTYHIAISNFIQNDLDHFSINYKTIPITPHTYEGFYPVSLGRSVYMYLPKSKQDFYGKPFLDKVKQLMPEQKFHICHAESYDRKQLIEIYKDCFIGLRLTEHDGLSNTVVELGLMGRRCIWNGGTPNAIPWRTNPQAIVNTINREKERQQNKYKQVAMQMQHYINYTNNWLKTDYYD